jgi:hypothetical protein
MGATFTQACEPLNILFAARNHQVDVLALDDVEHAPLERHSPICQLWRQIDGIEVE